MRCRRSRCAPPRSGIATSRPAGRHRPRDARRRRRRARLAITLDPKDGGPLYQGIVGLEAASIATLIEHYLTASEQIESRLVLATRGDTVRGLLLQRLPGAGPADDATWNGAVATAAALRPRRSVRGSECRGLPWRTVSGTGHPPVRTAQCALRLQLLAGADRQRAAPARPRGSRRHPRRAGMVSVTCEFCNRRYTLVAADARALFAQRPHSEPSRSGRAAGRHAALTPRVDFRRR